ncbi:serine/threonine-protein kinase [Planctomyces sp. SH-PL62]|uniref:serine/threonine-protein kinase n=1 Tax=Planctomyces sp. SH-PL62 TaxID=1636152 RepID=UPI00078D77FD|nr:serine/threonine-protein kinase [Planctomyces sp. SH-PL62]AMV38307.1 Serine/threonine-protein kinase PrkC [Planctomyces sp. SH-PL62]
MIVAKDSPTSEAARGPRLRIDAVASSAATSALTHILMSSPLDAGEASSAPPGVEPDRSATAAGGNRLRPFQRIGAYRLLVRLGRGAQGEVWKAVRSEGRDRVVALKILNPGLSIHPRRLAQFRREAERGARLDGPSLLQVIDAGEVDGCFYMAMPFVEAATLQDVIHERRVRRGGDPADLVHPLVELDDARYYVEIARTLVKAARALELVHRHRVVHRDVKPANILLERRRPFGVYLCDLGLGRDLDWATSEQMRDGAGTPMYMSPERLLKAPADEILSDVYSMGVTLFEALTLGRLYEPVRNVPLPALASVLAAARPRAPRSVDPNLPASFEPVLLRATARDPRARYRSAGDFADALESATPQASRDPAIEPAPGPRRPHYLSRPNAWQPDARAEIG